MAEKTFQRRSNIKVVEPLLPGPGFMRVSELILDDLRLVVQSRFRGLGLRRSRAWFAVTPGHLLLAVVGQVAAAASSRVL